MTTALLALPLRTPILDGEALDSWIDALARRNDTAPREVLRALGIDRPNLSISQLIDQTPPSRLRHIETATGLPQGRLDTASGVALTGIQRLGTAGSRFCPHCLAETHGRWPLIWRSNWSIACLRHGLLLADGCSECRTPPRIWIGGGRTPQPPARCGHRIDRSEHCCGDFTTGPTLAAPDEVLATQTWIDTLLGRTGDGDRTSAMIVADLPLVMNWLARIDHKAAETGASQLNRWRRRTILPTHNASTPKLDAALAAVLLARAAVILDGDDHAGIDELRGLLAGSTRKIPPPGFGRTEWNRLAHGRFANRHLRAVDSALTAADRLRMKTPTPAAALPGGSTADRVRSIPQLFWPDWAGRLLPVSGGFQIELFRATLAVMMTVPGDHSRTMAAYAPLFNPRVSRSGPTVILQGFNKLGDRTLTDALILLCRIADHLDTHGCPIDYQRRREQIPSELVEWTQWRDLACSVGAHPGDSKQARLRHAHRHLNQLLTGADLADRRHRLAFRNPQDRNAFLGFSATMTRPLRAALHAHAEQVLAELRIDEPLLWSPPSTLADGLELPGIDTDDLDISQISQLVIEDNKSPRETAEILGVHSEHVRIALERLDRPQRRWAAQAAPTSWRTEQQASAIFTREFFEREYLRAGRTLRDFAAETGIGRHIIARVAKQVGIDLRTGRDPLPIDADWLREQYCQRLRSTADIAAELGYEQMTVNLALRRYDIPARPPGVHSRTEMIDSGDHLPPLTRAAVTGTLHGWLRLHRFPIIMAFPTIETAANYLELPQSGLVHQLQRLERDTGTTLFHRSAGRNPQRPTEQGYALLRELDQPHIQEQMTAALSENDCRAMPSPDIVADALRIAATPPRRTVRLASFPDIPVRRLRMSEATRTLLGHITANPDNEFYGQGLSEQTGLAAGTLGPRLRQLAQEGWLTSRLEDEAEWLAGAPPGCGPGRRRIYYRLTPEGLRAALRQLDAPRKRTPHEKTRTNARREAP